MALFGALSTGRSGLTNNGAALSVIGNNIANVATVGFKGSRTEFADLISAEAGGEIGKIGLGARIGAVRTLFTQGAIEATGRSLDLGIEGAGFFVLGDNAGKLFTRAGNFVLQPDFTITNLIGKPLQGTPLNQDGTIAGGVQDVTLGNLNAQAKATENASLQGNLKADSPVIATAFDTATPSFSNAYAASNYPYSIPVFDSQGGAHQVSLFFKKTGDNTWDVHMGVDAGETGGTPGDLQLINGAGGTVTFNPDGTLASTSGLVGNVTFSGANAQTITLNLGTPNTTPPDGMTQYAGDFGINAVTQDGFGAGGLAKLDVDSKGILTATFDNGQTRPLYQLAIAHFNAPEGLAPAGNQMYRETIASGAHAIGFAGAQGNGTIVSSALEQSNVQIAQEFIELISTQRAFQANTRVITASDQLLGDLINIIR
jgi:flagellar hook protein FlgE